MPYKIDNTYYSTQFGSYQVFETWVIPLHISGSIPNNFYNTYQAVFNFTSFVAKARVSIQRPDTGLKAPFNIGSRLANYSPTYEVYEPAGFETVQTDTHYADADTLVVNMFIINETGSTINLVQQQLNILVEFYDAPIT